ncbi:DNA methylase N-4/N-6, partial [Pseudomonas amygdali pv. lachrymans]
MRNSAFVDNLSLLPHLNDSRHPSESIMSQLHQILLGDCIDVMRTLPDESVHTCVTSPPYYGLRDYGVEGQIGLEETPAEFIARLVDVFREVRRVLRADGTIWVNMGDSYATGGRGGGG